MEFKQQNPKYPNQSNQHPLNNGYYQNPQQSDNYNYPQTPSAENQVQSNNAQNEEKKAAETTPLTKKDIIFVTGFLLWIVGSIVAAILLVNTTGNIGWGLVSLGQFVFLFGIAMSISDKDKHGPSIYPGWILTGLIALVSGIVLVVTRPAFLNNLWVTFHYFLLAVFMVLTLLAIYNRTIGESKRKKRCKIPVNAEIIDHLRGTSYYSQGVYPLFRYTYNGVVYEKRDEMHAPREKAPPKGSYITLYINERNPEDFYSNWNGRSKTLAIEIGSYIGLLIFWIVAFFALPFIT